MDRQAFNLNNFTINNLLTTLGESYSKAAVQIVTDALEDINAAVSSTSNVSGYSAASLTDAQPLLLKLQVTKLCMKPLQN